MLVSKVLPANICSANLKQVPRALRPMVSEFVLPLKDNQSANITITENMKNGVIGIAYQIVSNGKAVESKCISDPRGIKWSSFMNVGSRFRNQVENGKSFFREFINTKTKLG